ncbi:MAG: flagellar biosynthetic protein FliR [Tatlockia sp.]|nr:flagellar biosynthetic protein FliR [Tatlockia sp.]
MISINLPTLSATFLVAIRLSVLLVFSPIQAIRQLPLHTRLILVLMLSVMLVSNLSLSASNINELSLISGAFIEFSNGLILSLSLYAAFAVFQIAGQLIDTQMGLNSLAIFNPGDHSHDPLTSRLLTMLAVLFFFALNGHHWLLEGLAYSFRKNPPGDFALINGFSLLVHQFSLMFALALMIASPVYLALLVIDISTAVLTRNMPQVSTYFLALPVKILSGFLLLALSLNYLNPLMEYLFRQCFKLWQELLA